VNHRKPLRNTDFLIVGAGALGLSTARELILAGNGSVEIIDRGASGREASWAGGGILFPLSPWDYAQSVTALTEMGRALYPQWVHELQAASGISPEYRQTGLLMLPPIDFIRARAWCDSQNVQATLLTEEDIPHSLAKQAQALWLPEVAQVRNPRLISSLVGSVRSLGTVVRENTEVTHLLIEKNRVTEISTKSGTISAGAVIICAGAWSNSLLGSHAAGANVFPVRGQMLLYKTPPRTLDSIVIKDGRYLIPRADGHILVGSTQEHVGFDKSPTGPAAIELHEFAQEVLPCLGNLQPVSHWTGLRPGSAGNIPVIARHPTIENLYLNSGHFRYGLTMAPAAAQIITNLIFGLPQRLDVTPYAWPTAREKGVVKIN